MAQSFAGRSSMEKELNMRLFAKSCDHPQWRSGHVRSGQLEGTRVKFCGQIFILRILNKSLPIHVVCMKRKLFSPHTLDSSIIMFTTELHNVAVNFLFQLIFVFPLF